MPSEFDIFRTANVFILRYGGEAPIRAGKRAADLYRQRDFMGCVNWLRTLKLIYELMTKQRHEDVNVH